MAMERLHLVVRGRVQGVAFRYYAQDRAEELGLTGWVRNRHDGAVELVAEGERDRLEQLIAWTRRGPSLARVDRLDETWEDFTGEFGDFMIAHSD